MELMVWMVDVGGMTMTAGYSHFYIDGMDQLYRAHVDAYYGEAGWSAAIHTYPCHFIFYLNRVTFEIKIYANLQKSTAGDYLYANNSQFSTFDMDNDGAPANCAQYFHSAWWYKTYGIK
jgi:hypothetical protein